MATSNLNMFVTSQPIVDVSDMKEILTKFRINSDYYQPHVDNVATLPCETETTISVYGDRIVETYALLAH